MRISRKISMIIKLLILISLVGVAVYVFFGVSKPKVSVIIPVYKTEKYLDECLESVENQTLREIEIVCVNDGSPDNSIEILKNHRKKDGRVKIINQENAGISMARNAGIKNSKGEYVLFLDSDDLISPKLCEIAYNKAKENKDADIVQFKFLYFNDGEKCDFTADSSEDLKTYSYKSRKESENPFETLGLDFNTVCNKLWKRSLITENNLKFKKGLNSLEDTLFNFLAFPSVKNCFIYDADSDVSYAYRKSRAGSVTTEKNNLRETKNRVTVCEELFANRDRFDFDGGEDWFVDMAVWLLYDQIFNKLKDEDYKIEYAKRAYDMISEYVKEHGYALSEVQKERYEALKAISES